MNYNQQYLLILHDHTLLQLTLINFFIFYLLLFYNTSIIYKYSIGGSYLAEV